MNCLEYTYPILKKKKKEHRAVQSPLNMETSICNFNLRRWGFVPPSSGSLQATVLYIAETFNSHTLDKA